MASLAAANILAQKYRKTRVLMFPSASLTAAANATTNADSANFRNSDFPFMLTGIYAEETGSGDLNTMRLRITDQSGFAITGPNRVWATTSDDLGTADRAMIQVPGGHEIPASGGFNVEVENTSATAGTVRVVLIGFQILEPGNWVDDLLGILQRLVARIGA